MTADSQVKETGYAPVNDLNMYYEIRDSGTGSDVPLVLIHGSFMTVEAMEPLVQAFVGERRVIVPEMQGHGRTNDVDRPLTYQQMADDTAGLLRHLGVERADIAGYSLGGGVAWQVAIRHPELVRKLVPIGIVTDTVPTRSPVAGGYTAVGATVIRSRTRSSSAVGTSAVIARAASTGTAPPRIATVPIDSPARTNVSSRKPSNPWSSRVAASEKASFRSPSTIATSRRPSRSATAIKHVPAPTVNPVFTPTAPR